MDDYFNNFADTTPNLSYVTQQHGFYKACHFIKKALSTGCQYPAGFPRTMTEALILRKILEETGSSSHSLAIFSKISRLKSSTIVLIYFDNIFSKLTVVLLKSPLAGYKLSRPKGDCYLLYFIKIACYNMFLSKILYKGTIF
ncbi:hypothetical protein ACPUYX_03445 [Desulfosporosinus sp. SYSU MS00001]|uniref:hypothetical protein n=1 Tax=Desulfosporosinus sp. SYSU MS00001 TaxID=3416284 RepID=UPI003CEABA8C